MTTFNPMHPVKQRNGRKAIILGVIPADLVRDGHTIAALVESFDEEGWSIETFKPSGHYKLKGGISDLDLVNIPQRYAVKFPVGRSDMECGLRRSFPVLALLSVIEAVADMRTETDVVNYGSKLAAITGWAREAMKALTGTDHNPIYPVRRETTLEQINREYREKQQPAMQAAE